VKTEFAGLGGISDNLRSQGSPGLAPARGVALMSRLPQLTPGRFRNEVASSATTRYAHLVVCLLIVRHSQTQYNPVGATNPTCVQGPEYSGRSYARGSEDLSM